MSEITCRIHSIEPLTPTVFKVLLKPETPVTHKAGQYLQIKYAEGDLRPFSIASAPKSELLELHIGASKQDSYPMQVIDMLKEKDTVEVDIPYGDAYYRSSSDRPVILVAGGTGYSYAYSILQYLLEQRPHIPVTLFWGAREPSHMYYHDQMTELADANKQFTFVPVVDNPPENWQGKTGFVHQAVVDCMDDITGSDVYVAGRFEMAGLARTLYVEHGLASRHIFGDAFAYL